MLLHINNLIIYIVIGCCLLFKPGICQIDPFAMDFTENVKDLKIDCPKMNGMAVTFYKRAINMILNIMQLDQEQTTYNGQIYLQISIEEFQFLNSFAKNEEDNVDIFHKVDNILSKVYAKPIGITMLEKLQFWIDNIYMNCFNRRTMIFLSLLLILYVSYKLLRANLTLTSIIKHLLFIAWVVDYVFIWINLLQNAEINKITDMLRYKNIPVQCDPSKMTYWEKLWYSLSSSDECKKYHNVMMGEEFWSVSPFTVLSHQFDILVKTPIVTVGNALGEMIAAMMTHFPWYMNFILVPMILLCFLFLSCVFLSFTTNQLFKINLFHMVQLQFGGTRTNKNFNALDETRTKKNFNALDGESRPMVEEIEQTTNLEIGKDNKIETKNLIQVSVNPEVEEEINVCILRRNKKLVKNNEKEKLVDTCEIKCLESTNKESSKEDNKIENSDFVETNS